MISLAMLSFWHVHARGYARQALEHPGTRIVACWDEEPERGREQADELEVPFHADLAELLAREDVDGVIVDTPTNMHPPVMIAAAKAGKHIFTEKVLALTEAGAAAILEAVDAAGVRLVVSLPRLVEPYTLAIGELIDSGALGEVTEVRTRMSHGGALGEAWLPAHFFDAEQCGGGAMVDLGCHPMYLAEKFLGRMPISVSADYGFVTGRAVDDNAVVTLRCDNGAIGVVEAGFVNRYSPFSIEVHGTEGSALFGLPRPILQVRSPAHGDGADWTEVPLPAAAPSSFEQFVQHIEAGTSATENIETAMKLTRLMEAANHSAATDAPVRLAPR